MCVCVCVCVCKGSSVVTCAGAFEISTQCKNFESATSHCFRKGLQANF